MNLARRIDLMVQLGEHLSKKDEYLDALMHRTHYNNQWFTIENQRLALNTLVSSFLKRDKIENWLNRYTIQEPISPKKVGIIMAGNIPLVGFHDLLSTFLSGHYTMMKLSDKDQYILPYFVKLLSGWDAEAKDYFQFVQHIKDFDAVIATGSNNSARYFEAYFGKFPNIIRKNRNGVAVLTGKESREELFQLGEDIFKYFGLGCRNVAKLYLPKGYEFKPLMEELHKYNSIVLNNKYKNNFDYNYSLYVLNKVPIINNGCIMLVEDTSFQSRISALHYEFYESKAEVEEQLQVHKEDIQCIIAKEESVDLPSFSFGEAQKPKLWDYADGVDTIEFLTSLN